MGVSRSTTQSPKAYDTQNLSGTQLIGRFTRGQFYSKLADPFRVQCDQFGLSAGATKAVNGAALEAAIAAAVTAGNRVVELPAGSFAIDDRTILIPPGIVVTGPGNAQCNISSDNTGAYAFALGAKTKGGVFNYGCGLINMQLTMTQANGKGVVLMETVGAIVENLYIQGPITASRSTKGLVIDGGDISAFFNVVKNVECAHCHIGFDTLTSGSGQPTQNTFTDISASGDVGTDTTSVGFRIQGVVAGTGQATAVYNSDMESCKYGYYLTATCGPSSYYGSRAEGNTDDIYIETGAGLTQWFGGVLDIDGGHVLVQNGNNLAAANNSAGHSFIATINGNGNPNVQYMAGNIYFNGFANGDIPLTGVCSASSGANTAILSLQNTAGDKLFEVSKSGKITRIANNNIVTVTGAKAGNLALADLVTVLANYGLIVDGTT